MANVCALNSPCADENAWILCDDGDCCSALLLVVVVGRVNVYGLNFRVRSMSRMEIWGVERAFSVLAPE